MLEATYECAACGCPVKNAAYMFCSKCYRLYAQEPWAQAMKRDEQSRRNRERNVPVVLSLSSLSLSELSDVEKVC